MQNEEHDGGRFADDPSAPPGDGPSIPRAYHAPTLLLLALIWAAFLFTYRDGQADWGVSGAGIGRGDYAPVFLHMFAHAGFLHIGMNSAVLLGLGGLVTTYMGRVPACWSRFLAFYLLSGLSGALVYLAINPSGTIPMVGASGAISGLIGVVSRLAPGGLGLMPLSSPEFRRRTLGFLKANLVLIALFAGFMLLVGGGGGIAWEAHLGGFLFGVFGARWFIEPAYRSAASHSDA